MEFAHLLGYLHTVFYNNAVVWDPITCMGFYDFSLMDVVANALLLIRNCSPDCHFDCSSTLELFAYNCSEDSAFVLSSSLDSAFQLARSGSALRSLTSDLRVSSPFWLLLIPLSTSTPTPWLVQLVPSSGAPLLSLTNHGLAPTSSFFVGCLLVNSVFTTTASGWTSSLTLTIVLLVLCLLSFSLLHNFLSRPPPLLPLNL